jgi:hypothetical protein
MSDTLNARRQPALYWKQMAELKGAAICIRLYRNQLAQRIGAVELVKAIGSGGGIAGWVVWRDLPFLWAGIIAAAQFLDATKHVFPFARQHKAASDLTVALELLYIDAEEEWESIHLGTRSDEAVIEGRSRLRKLQLEAYRTHFPDGFAPGSKLIVLAGKEAKAYLAETFGEDPRS